MSLKLFFDTLSQPSRALLIFFKINKVPFEERYVNLAKGEHFGEEFTKINPIKKVPVITHGQFTLTESVAIVRYVSREFNIADFWYPKEIRAQAKVDEYMEWQHLNTRLACAMYFQTKWLLPIMSGKPAKPERVAFFEKRVVDTLDIIENIWLNNKSYLTGNQISVADIFGACEIEQTRLAGYDPYEGRPVLKEWMERVKKETSPYYEEAHAVVNKIANKHKGEPPASLSKL